MSPDPKPTDASAEPEDAALKRPSAAFLAVVTLATLAADLATKWWVTTRFADPLRAATDRVDVIADRVTFIFAKNRGGAFGLLQNESESIRRPFFMLIAVFAVGFILSLYRKLSPRQWALKWGLPLVLGGAVGNLVDRIRYDFVVDFIDIRITDSPDFPALLRHWPTFNVADIAIVVGVGLMAIDMFTARPPKKSVAATTALPAEEQAAGAGSSGEGT